MLRYEVAGMDRRNRGYILAMEKVISAVYTDKDRDIL